MYHHYCIPLNKTSLILVHPEQTHAHTALVVQVTIKHAGESVINELAQFYIFHHEITRAIENLICTHICASLPQKIEIEGDSFVLCGSHKPWPYGKTIAIKWGDEVIKPAEDKWTFVVHAIPKRGS